MAREVWLGKGKNGARGKVRGKKQKGEKVCGKNIYKQSGVKGQYLRGIM